MVAFDFTVFIGRFQPFHKGHEAVAREALRHSRHLIMLCGSAHQPRSLRNPWFIHEREEMIRACFSTEENQFISVVPLMDVTYNDELWVRGVQETVKGLVRAHHSQLHREPSIALIGHSKDHSSYYPSLFPQWGSIEVANVENLCSTRIREKLFIQKSKETFAAELPEGARRFVETFTAGKDFKTLCDENDFIRDYKKGWEKAPYPPVFVTVDAVVVQSGHLLMVERNANPGKGLLALPGGFIDQEERLLDACLRELHEETRLKVPLPVLKGSIKAQQVFDDPYRSARGRTITHAFYILLSPDVTLPKVKGGDDARHALWVPLGRLNPSQIFEDHYFIIQKMLGIV